MIPASELIEKVTAYNKDADVEKIQAAYDYGLSKHGTQTRASGEGYFRTL